MSQWKNASMLVAAFLSAMASFVRADSPPPRPRIFSSEWGTHAFKVLESKVTGSYKGLLFTLEADGKERVLWSGTLVNVPQRVFVSEDGKRVVTIETYGSSGEEHVVVVYDDKGKVLADYKKLEELLTKEELQFMAQGITSRMWTPYAAFAFSSTVKPKQFLITVKRADLFTAALQRLKEVPTKLRIDNPKEREDAISRNEKRIEEVQSALRDLDGQNERVIKIDLESGKLLGDVD